MHKHSKQQAPLAVVVDPYDENPVRYDLNYKENIIGDVQCSEGAYTPPEIRKEMPDSPNHPDYKTRSKSTMASLKSRDRESCPTNFLKKACDETQDNTETQESSDVPGSDHGGQEYRRDEERERQEYCSQQERRNQDRCSIPDEIDMPSSQSRKKRSKTISPINDASCGNAGHGGAGRSEEPVEGQCSHFCPSGFESFWFNHKEDSPPDPRVCKRQSKETGHRMAFDDICEVHVPFSLVMHEFRI